MTESQLDEIERNVGFALPAEYRRTAVNFPFRPIGRDGVYWFYDNPNLVIDATRTPLADGDFGASGWHAGYLAIGGDGGGNLFVLDTTAPGLPVHCLGHETHRIEPEYPTFASFVQAWLKAPDEVEANIAAERAAERAEWRRRIRRVFLFVVCSIPVSIVLAWLVSAIALWLR